MLPRSLTPFWRFRPSRAPLTAGAATLALVGACVAFAWPHDSALYPSGGGHPHGDPLWGRLFLGCSIAAFVAYLVGLALLSRRRLSSTRAVAALAVAIQLAPLAGPLLLSTDAWTYWSYGRIAAVHGGNPYTQPPAAYPGDPALAWVGAGWRTTTTVYGPAFTLASEPLALAAGRSADAAAWIFKGLAAAAVVVAAALAARLSRRPVFAWAFVGWNPLLALHFGGGGHNDAWMMALVLAALALAASGRRRLAGAAWAAAILAKWVPAVFLVLRAVEARGSGRRVQHLGFAVTAAAVAAIASARYGWHWLHVFVPLLHNAERETRFSIPHRLEQAGLPHGVTLALCAVLAAAAAVWLVREARLGRARLGLAAALMLLLTPWLIAWYAVWSIPLAAAEDDRPAQLLSLALCAYLLRQAVPL